MIIKECKDSFDSCVQRVKERIVKAGSVIFAEIDHSKNAKEVGMELEPTKVLIFGNPRVGTILMREKREISYELPLRLVIWESSGRVQIGYRKPSHVAQEYGLNNEILKKMDEFMENITSV
ncbi:DUF302 domain-containing protein [Metallosphaera tengchongensis]|uniref:DUF302 domain-containing protein n=1 Tax=Metallosphaera tengchongensis TaxID=1532350 RepID=A0A6N0NT57_9CREN|nr:DUF302 domain-containing protein [Metallosphaera tengchongensis]QKQ99038.1 DUF302 domain-containing protein [Metallosphaera tengchongensis]